MSEKHRMLAGRLYLAFDEELGRDNRKARMLTRLFNSSTEEQQDYRKILLKQLFKATGDNIYIEPPFRTDYGCNTSIGENFYANYDCIIIDVCSVTIGRNVFFAPQGLYLYSGASNRCRCSQYASRIWEASVYWR
jgi:maltose O-acetyltransferase